MIKSETHTKRGCINPDAEIYQTQGARQSHRLLSHPELAPFLPPLQIPRDGPRPGSAWYVLRVSQVVSPTFCPASSAEELLPAVPHTLSRWPFASPGCGLCQPCPPFAHRGRGNKLPSRPRGSCLESRQLPTSRVAHWDAWSWSERGKMTLIQWGTHQENSTRNRLLPADNNWFVS